MLIVTQHRRQVQAKLECAIVRQLKDFQLQVKVWQSRKQIGSNTSDKS